jgi:hypothetical protein
VCVCFIGAGAMHCEDNTRKIAQTVVAAVAALEPAVRHLGATSYHVVALHVPDSATETALARWNLQCRYLWSALCSRSDQLTYETMKARRLGAPTGTHIESVQQPVRGAPPGHHAFVHAHFSVYKGRPRYWCVRMRGDACLYDTFWYHDDIRDRLPADHPLLVASPVLAIRDIPWEKLSCAPSDRIYYDVSRDDQRAVSRYKRATSASTAEPAARSVSFNAHLAAVLAARAHDGAPAAHAFAAFAALVPLTSSPDRGDGVTVCAAYSSARPSRSTSHPRSRVAAPPTKTLESRATATLAVSLEIVRGTSQSSGSADLAPRQKAPVSRAMARKSCLPSRKTSFADARSAHTPIVASALSDGGHGVGELDASRVNAARTPRTTAARPTMVPGRAGELDTPRTTAARPTMAPSSVVKPRPLPRESRQRDASGNTAPRKRCTTNTSAQGFVPPIVSPRSPAVFFCYRS